MFEKEAEEWINREYDNSYYPDCNFSARQDAKTAFKGGAEFGYNKAKEELENKNAELKELLKEAVQLLKNSDELYSYQIRDFQLKCEQFTKEIKE